MSDNDLNRFKKGVAATLIAFWMANVTASAIPALHYTPPIYVHWFAGAAVMTVLGLERFVRWWRGGGSNGNGR